MKKSISFWQMVGFIAAGVGGTLLHFLYALSNESVLVTPFSAVNESTWGHMKLMYFHQNLFY